MNRALLFDRVRFWRGARPLCATFAVTVGVALPALGQEPAPAGPALPPIEKGFPTAPAATPQAPAAAPEAPAPAQPAAEPAAAEAPAPAPQQTPAPALPAAEADAPAAGAPVAEPAPEPVAPAAATVAEQAAEEEPEGSLRHVPGRGFAMTSGDGHHELALGGWAQFRYTLSSREVEPQTRQSMTVQRARIWMRGHVFGEHNRYGLQLALAPDESRRRQVDVVDADDASADQATATDVVGQTPLLDFFLDFTHMRDLSVRLGQYILPFSRQRIIPESARTFGERPGVDQEFQLDRDIGILLFSNDLGGLDMFRYSAGVSAGEGPGSGARTIGAGDMGLLYMVRFDVLPLGLFNDGVETDFERTPEPRFGIGVAYALVQADATSPYARRFLTSAFGGGDLDSEIDFNNHQLTIDAQFKYLGFGVHGAFHLRAVDGNLPQVDGFDVGREGKGYLISLNYLFESVPLEPAFRYGILDYSDSVALADVNEVGVSLSYYLARNWLKVMADYTHFLRAEGVEAKRSDLDDRLRVQVQIAL
ncbi:MAG: hypothetical protein OEZ06_07375 [Myxococcales bacterium]|nr:hypothetical protein [Myxococcales bacterium]